MSNTVQSLLLSAIIAILCGLGAYILQSNKKGVLALISDLVQKAEAAVQGSGLGQEKKKWVITQLQAAGVKVTSWVSAQIDFIVKLLNDKSGWRISADSTKDKPRDSR